MKRILISGHTSGIGKAIAEKFISNDYEVTGYSRTNGRDLHDKHTIGDFIRESNASDVIVLNADLKYDSVHILYQLYYIGIVRPGYVDTPRVKSVKTPKIDSAHIADIVYDMVDAKQNKKYNVLSILVVPNK